MYGKKRGKRRGRKNFKKTPRVYPRRKNYRRNFKKRTRWAPALPTKTSSRLKFRFIDNGYDMSTLVGSAYQALQVFRGNSLFDPDYSGVGVQPYGFDNQAAMFTRYKVLSSKIKVYLTTLSGVNCPKIRAYIMPNLAISLAYNDTSDLARMPYVKAKTFGLGSYKSQGLQCSMKNYATTNQILGKARGNDGDSSSTVGANPTNAWYWLIYVDTSEFTHESTISMDVKITYYAEMTSPPSQDES